MDIPVYVINLKSSVARKNNITNRLKNSGIPHTIIEAIEGAGLHDQDSGNLSAVWKQGSYTRNLLKGEIGCVLSHFLLYRRMIDEDIHMACILEDDAEPEDNFRDFLFSGNIAVNDWDLLFLGHHSMCSKKETSSVKRKDLKIPAYSIGEPVEIPVGSYGYIIKRNAAARILERGYPVRKPLDLYIGNASALGIKVEVLSPPCLKHNYKFLSTIYREDEIIFADTLIESFRKKVRKTYKWLPALRTLRIWIAIKTNDSVILLRKTGLLSKSYAKFD